MAHRRKKKEKREREREEAWKRALTSILEELDDIQYEKMLENLPEIPKSQRKSSHRVNMPQIILEHYEFMESIRVIDEVMEQIPRRDSPVQGPLRPFVDLLKKKDKDGTNKRKRGVKEEEEEEDEPVTGKKRRHDAGEEEEVQREKEVNKDPPAADQQTSCRDNEETTAPPTPAWKKSIRDVKASAELRNTDAFTGKVVQKSGLRTYQTQAKEEKFFFYLGLADKTDSIKLMVYGKKRYTDIKEGKTYMFRRILRDEDRLKVTLLSVVSLRNSVDVSDELMTQARKLIYVESPVFLISDINSFPDKKEVSVEGTVTEVDPIELVEVRNQQEKRERQMFHLADETGSIKICMWGEETEKIKDLSVDDVIQVTNLKIHRYHSLLSLNSTEFSKIHKIKSVGRHKVQMTIEGIIEATEVEAQLEVEFNQQVHTFVVSSSLLAEAFNLKLDAGFTDKLLDMIPHLAEAEIEGNRIMKIKAAS